MSKAPSPPLDADLAIVGAGPAGASLALLAANAGLDTVLIDGRPTGPPPQRDRRNFAIVRGSWRLLEAAGVGAALAEQAQPLHGLSATDGGRHWFGAPEAEFSEGDLDGAEPLGFMVEAPELQAALDEALSRSRVDHRRPARFEGVRVEDSAAIVSLAGGAELRVSVVAGCDGASSPVRAAAGIGVEGRDYGKSVFSANVAIDRPHGGVARQLFTPGGPFATLPLRGDRVNLAWYMATGAAEALSDCSNEDIEAELNARFAAFAGRMVLEERPLAYPLVLQIAESMVAPRVALVGDAARRVNPLAGQGLNLGFKDVGALVETLVDAANAGLDIGSTLVLERYQRWRRFDAAATAMALDGVDRLFSNDSAILKPIRSLGLAAAQRIAPIRKAMTRQASADQPSLPKLFRGEPLV